MTTHVLYHDACADGFCAAWAANLSLRSLGPNFIPVQYGQPIPSVIQPGDRVYIVDFCYDEPEMRQLLAVTTNLVVLDHHQSRKDLIHKLAAEFTDHAFPIFRFGDNISGGRMAWNYFHGNGLEEQQATTDVPWLVAYTEDRDLWRWNLPRSRAISAGIKSHPFSLALWDDWHCAGSLAKDRLAKDGEAILRYQDQVIDHHLLKPRWGAINGNIALIVNATTLISEIGQELAKWAPVGACYFDVQDEHGGPTTRVWSLRSTSGCDTDVSVIAAQFGGGGHKHAAGFTTDTSVLFLT